MQQPRWTWSTVAIVSAMVAFVFGPVFIPREVSRWYLAAAANAYRIGDRDTGAQYLDRAVDWDPSILFDGNYWIAQMGNRRSQTLDQMLDLLEKAIETDPSSAGVASTVANALAEEFEFERAVRALKMAHSTGQPRTANDLNMLAYLRAQAGIELDEALKDINRALELAGPNHAFLDTKAWVLHKMNRNLEALGILNGAIKKLEDQLGKSKAEPSKKEPESEGKKEPEASGDSAASSSEAESKEANQPEESLSEAAQVRKQIQLAQARLGHGLWHLAVLRFHRLRIYEALEQHDEAQQERQWLTDHGVPIVDELF